MPLPKPSSSDCPEPGASQLTVRLGFVDFWPGFVPQQSFFWRTLSQRFQLVLDDAPQFLFYSCFGRQHQQSRAVRIFFSGENQRPDFTTCDYALTSDWLDHPRHYRLPLYVLEGPATRLIKPADFDAAAQLRRKTRFCNFVYSNPRCRARNRFYRRLSHYRPIDSGGRLDNNLGYVCSAEQKTALLCSSKFTIAFENSSYPGYTTEKIVHAMLACSLPIYWGNPLVARDFNPRSFLNAHDFPSQTALLRRVQEIDQHDELYLDYLRQPWLHDNRPSPSFDSNALLDWFQQVFTSARQPLATQPTTVSQRLQRAGQRLRRNTRRIWRDITRRLP